MKAILRTIRISPKKANLVAGTVRGKKVDEALALLKFMPKKGAQILYKVIHSAASNAKHNFNQSLDELEVSKILVTKGPTYKRSVPISRGRAHPIRKRTSHITVEVSSVVTEKTAKEMKKAEVKKEEAPAKAKTTPAKKDLKKEVSSKKTSSTKK